MGDKLAEILAKKKAARAAREGGDNGCGENGIATLSLEDDSSLTSGEAGRRRGACVTSDSGLSGGAVVSSATTMVPEVDFREIEMEDQDKVAQGGLGVLYKGTWRGCAVAVKRPVDPRAVMDADLKEDFRREAAILSEVRHPNVVLLLGASLQGANLCLVLEWCNGGNLHELIHHPRDAPLAKIEKVGLLAGLAAAVAWLHTSSPAIIHRDIKPANVLVDGTRTVAKLCDFGLAIRNSEVASTRSDAGTPQYMAPELYRGECCSLESDVYAIGMSLWEALAEEYPFGGMELTDIKAAVTGGNRPGAPITAQHSLQALYKACTEAAASARPTALGVLGKLREIKS